MKHYAHVILGRKPAYALNQFKPITRFTADPTVLVVRADAPWTTLAEFIADAKKKPGKFDFGSSGNYGTMHLPMEMLKARVGIFLTHIPYTGAGSAVLAMLGGQVDAVASGPSTVALQHRGQRVTGWLDLRFAASRHEVQVPTSASLAPLLGAVLQRVSHTALVGACAPRLARWAPGEVSPQGLRPCSLPQSETLIDEIARQTRPDPVAYRMALMGDKHPRHRAALQLAVDKSGYGRSKLTAGRAWGVAVHESFGSVVAYVVEATMNKG